MLEYGLPDTPEPEQRWYITVGSSREYRYLNLQKPVKDWRGRVRWETVHEDMISTGRYAGEFEKEVIASAYNILRELRVNFNLPTGEVR